MRSWRLTAILVLAVVGLLGASMGGVTLSEARCSPDSGRPACSAATMDTETPDPTATIHQHVNFSGWVWDNAVGTPLPRALVVITNCRGSDYEATTSAAGYYSNWHPTDGEFSCGVVAYDVSASGHVTMRQSVRRDSDRRDFVLARLPASILYLPHAGVEQVLLR